MSEMSMVEKVAHAMAQRSDARVAGMFTINALPMRGQENFLELAKAAIEALRVPTEAMIDAAEEGFPRYREYDVRDREYARKWYSGMIDAALKE